MNVEIAQAMKDVSILALANKTLLAPQKLDETEKVAYAEFDKAFKKIGETGNDSDRLIAALITKTIEEDVVNADDSLLDLMFERGNVGEFDAIEGVIQPKNTLVAYEASKGGNVDRSWIDVSALTPTTKHLQVETDISYADLRKNGWKSVALLTTYIAEALQNKRYRIIFDALDAAIVSGDNFINETTKQPTETSMGALSTYILDVADGDGVIVALNKYIKTISKLTGYQSDAMLDELYTTGLHKYYDGIPMKGVSATKKMGDGNALIPDKRIFGIAGKIGFLDQRGDIRTYEDYDNQKEVIKIKTTGFEFSTLYNTDTLKKIAKIKIADD